MGYELRRWLADRLPAGLSSGERLVALEIADQAGEQSRRAYGTGLLDTVVRRTGLADQKQLGKILGKLAANGIELRVPVRGRDGQVVTDSRGRVLYACKGHALEFRIPTDEECPALLLPQAGDLQSSPSEGSNERKAPPPGAQSSPARGTKLPQAGDPSPQSPQDLSSLTPRDSPTPPPSQPTHEREKNLDRILAAYAEALGRKPLTSLANRLRAQAAQLLDDGQPAWWIEDRAREMPAKNWTDLALHCERSNVPTKRVITDTKAGWCGECFAPNYRMRKDPERDNELVECDTCNPVALARKRRAQQGDTAA